MIIQAENTSYSVGFWIIPMSQSILGKPPSKCRPTRLRPQTGQLGYDYVNELFLGQIHDL